MRAIANKVILEGCSKTPPTTRGRRKASEVFNWTLISRTLKVRVQVLPLFVAANPSISFVSPGNREGRFRCLARRVALADGEHE